MDLTKLNDILELAGAAVLGLHGVFLALRALVVVLDKVVALTPSKWDDSLLAQIGSGLDAAAACSTTSPKYPCAPEEKVIRCPVVGCLA